MKKYIYACKKIGGYVEEDNCVMRVTHLTRENIDCFRDLHGLIGQKAVSTDQAKAIFGVSNRSPSKPTINMMICEFPLENIDRIPKDSVFNLEQKVTERTIARERYKTLPSGRKAEVIAKSLEYGRKRLATKEKRVDDLVDAYFEMLDLRERATGTSGKSSWEPREQTRWLTTTSALRTELVKDTEHYRKVRERTEETRQNERQRYALLSPEEKQDYNRKKSEATRRRLQALTPEEYTEFLRKVSEYGRRRYSKLTQAKKREYAEHKKQYRDALPPERKEEGRRRAREIYQSMPSDAKEAFIARKSELMKKAWDSLTPEEQAERNKVRMERYHAASPEEKGKRKKHRSEKWKNLTSDEKKIEYDRLKQWKQTLTPEEQERERERQKRTARKSYYKLREAETPEEREERLAKKRDYCANLSPERKNARVSTQHRWFNSLSPEEQERQRELKHLSERLRRKTITADEMKRRREILKNI